MLNNDNTLARLTNANLTKTIIPHTGEGCRSMKVFINLINPLSLTNLIPDLSLQPEDVCGIISIRTC